MRQKVFISYSHADSEYAQRIYTQLTSYDVREEMIFLDHAAREGIEPGEHWQARIEAEIAEARVALFIVSQNSRNSDFINESELKPILAARDKGHKITIFWIRVVQVDPPSGLMEYQGLCNGEILGTVETLKGQRQIDEIAKAITGELNLHPSLSEQFYNRVAKIARQEYGLIIDREIAVGEKSVVYRGSGSGQTAAIKARLATNFELFSTPSNEALQERLAQIKDVRHEAFIEFFGGIIQDDTQILVSEFLRTGRALDKKLAELRQDKARLSVDRVRLAVSSLAGALAAFHKKGIAYGNLRPSDVLFIVASKDDWHVRIPKFRMTRMDELEGAPARRLSFHPEVVTYLAPEQHKKLMITQKTDQYSLALLAIEMLQGEPPVLVKSLSDIKRKEKFFNKPEAFAKNWSARSPRLRKVLYKMLSKDPKDRYASMQEIVDELETAKNTREDSRRIAKQSYAALAPHKLEVLGDFYDMLFARFPALKVHFKRDIKSPALLRKLDRAILYLINFRPEDMAHEPTILTGIRESHAKYGLLEQDFDNFAECLLDALHHVGETSEETQEAWRTTLAPGLAYMKDCCVAEFEIEAEVTAGAETQDTSEPAEVSD